MAEKPLYERDHYLLGGPVKTIRQFVIDAFTDKVFSGNTAAVCILDEMLDDRTMQNIAMENRFSETAFATFTDPDWNLRWFTPGGEIDLCGHATLGCACAILNYYSPSGENEVRFVTRSGLLTVQRQGDFYAMNFPAYTLKKVAITQQIIDSTGEVPQEAWLGRDLLCVYDNEGIVRSLSPDLSAIKKLDGLLFHATARSEKYDCVPRSFAPKLDVPEDPVCGSGHCHIVPYWSRKLHKDRIIAWQASSRGGLLRCDMMGNRVILAGQAAVFSEGNIFPA